MVSRTLNSFRIAVGSVEQTQGRYHHLQTPLIFFEHMLKICLQLIQVNLWIIYLDEPNKH